IRFIAMGKSSMGRAEIEVWTHQQFVDASEPLLRAGFTEREIFRSTRRYGNMAHVDSTYEAEAGAKRSRGVNSVEMYSDGSRRWISAVMWQTEDTEHPIPHELLP